MLAAGERADVLLVRDVPYGYLALCHGSFDRNENERDLASDHFYNRIARYLKKVILAFQHCN